MNRLKGKIVDVSSEENISVVKIKVDDILLTSVLLETPETAEYLKIGRDIFILFKETEVSIGKNIHGEISLSNRIETTVKDIKKGKILTQLRLSFSNKEITSIITTESAKRLNLKVGDKVVAFIKANEVSLMEIVDG